MRLGLLVQPMVPGRVADEGGDAELGQLLHRAGEPNRTGPKLSENSTLDAFAKVSFETQVANYNVSNYGFQQDYSRSFPGSTPQIGEDHFLDQGPTRPSRTSASCSSPPPVTGPSSRTRLHPVRVLHRIWSVDRGESAVQRHGVPRQREHDRTSGSERVPVPNRAGGMARHRGRFLSVWDYVMTVLVSQRQVTG